MRALLMIFTWLALAGPTVAFAQDADGDGSPAGVDCDDNDPNNFPGNVEACDGFDNDCNGLADFGVTGGGPGETWAAAGGGAITNSDFTKGNVMRATSDTVVSEFAMALDMVSATDLTLTIGEGAAVGGPFTVVAQANLGAVAAGQQLHRMSGLSVPLTNGNYYAFVATWTGGDATNYYGSTPADPSWGVAETGAFEGNAPAPAGTWTPTSLPGGLYDMEIVTGGGASTWSADAGASINSMDYTKGNVFQATSAATVTSWGMPLDVANGQVSLTISEGASSSGPFTVIDQVDLGVVPSGLQVHRATGLGVALNPGSYYAFVASWSGDAGHFYDTNGAATDPNWGVFATGAWNSTSAVPVSPWTPNNTPNGAYDMEITVDGAGSTELDADGDGSLVCGGDCDDQDATAYPGAVELCDGADNDCNGLSDFDIAGEVDADGDAFRSCDDCNDADSTIYPGAPEQCDGVDNDCNGVADADVAGEIDADSDGYLSCEDCDDADGLINPGATEICDGLDNDCDGLANVNGGSEEDVDLDGYLACEDCDDGNDLINPGATELCDGLDNDCDGVPLGGVGGESDGDSDGYLACEDCDDNEPAVNPGATEVCDGLDNDCDGTDPATELDDLDGDGVAVCDGDCDDSAADAFPGGVEVCDGLDNNCDGTVDEGLDCEPVGGDTGGSVDPTDKGGCGCSTSPAPGAAWVLGLVLLATRRRKGA